MSVLRVILVDDHEVVRMGLRLALEDVADVEIIGEGRSADEAIALCVRYQPDVVIMDIRMPGQSGIDACQEITSRWPRTAVVMLTSYAEDDLIADAIAAGATGYVLKQGGTMELLRALQAAREGAGLLDPAITRRVMTMMRHRSRYEDPFRELTERELDVLQLLAKGKTNAEIADALVLSEKTVRNHVSSVLSKLGVSNRVEAATYAVENRLSAYLAARGK